MVSRSIATRPFSRNARSRLAVAIRSWAVGEILIVDDLIERAVNRRLDHGVDLRVTRGFSGGGPGHDGLQSLGVGVDKSNRQDLGRVIEIDRADDPRRRGEAGPGIPGGLEVQLAATVLELASRHGYEHHLTE